MSKKLVTGIVVGTVALALIGAGAIAAQIIPEEEIKESQSDCSKRTTLSWTYSPSIIIN